MGSVHQIPPGGGSQGAWTHELPERTCVYVFPLTRAPRCALKMSSYGILLQEQNKEPSQRKVWEDPGLPRPANKLKGPVPGIALLCNFSAEFFERVKCFEAKFMLGFLKSPAVTAVTKFWVAHDAEHSSTAKFCLLLAHTIF